MQVYAKVAALKLSCGSYVSKIGFITSQSHYLKSLSVSKLFFWESCGGGGRGACLSPPGERYNNLQYHMYMYLCQIIDALTVLLVCIA